MLEEREYDSSAQTWQPRRQFIYGGLYIDEPLIFDRDTTGNGVLDTRYYYAQQANFNVVAVAKDNGDGTATVVETITYDPYGEPDVTVAQGHTPSGNPYLFQGRRFDAETGLYYFRNRMYSAELGRFIQRDPLGYVDGMNLYEFVRGRVTVAKDPTGQMGCAPNDPWVIGNPQQISFEVNCRGEHIGNLQFTIASGQDREFGALSIVGGFKAVTDYREEPCCCKQLRWIQTVRTNVPKGDNPVGVPYIDGRPNDILNEPFYYHTRTNHALRNEGRHTVADYRNYQGYDLHCYDQPSRLWNAIDFYSPPTQWAAELCLVCVREHSVEPLQCFTYGFTLAKTFRVQNLILWVRVVETGERDVDVHWPRDTGTGTDAFRETVQSYGVGWRVGP